MKNKKLLVVLSILTVMVLGLASVSYALATYSSRPEAAAGLTGKSVDEVIAARKAGSSYSEQAEAAGKLDEFKAEVQQQFKDRLDALVKEGRLTQDQANDRTKLMEERIADCDGEGAQDGTGIFGGMGGNGMRDGSGQANPDRPQDGTGAQGGRGGRGSMGGRGGMGSNGLRDGSGFQDSPKSST